ncbi:hypothetical protein [Methylobacterium oryzisoli]|uniref:hypothetical protein n=1 Tax=Methylobacterium oryzisoli TaxID=3385502 RepID=UPI003891CCB9
MAVHRFSVIQGGAPDQEPGRWTTEIVRPSEIGEADIAGWRALLARAAEASVLADPDVLLTLAQHCARGQLLRLLLVRQGSEGGRILRGVLPLRVPGGLWPRGATHPWSLPLIGTCAPVIEAARAGAVLRAVLDDLAADDRRIETLRLAGLAPAGPLAAALAEAAAGAGRRLSLRPREDRSAPPRLSPDPLPRAPTSLERVREPHHVRDAVERFLALDASGPGACLLDDPPVATAFRVVVRRFAHRREACIDLVRRDGAVIAAAIHLGPPGRDRVWRRAGLSLAGAQSPPQPGLTLEAELSLTRAGRREPVARPIAPTALRAR